VNEDFVSSLKVESLLGAPVAHEDPMSATLEEASPILSTFGGASIKFVAIHRSTQSATKVYRQPIRQTGMGAEHDVLRIAPIRSDHR
jgi:hypothetical protein